ncbi:MAG: 2-C-methyl-D-erythritol 2,4-cyclodiphosphate synthase [Candidatus Omnitrophica bacterium]|nr:2-C-methyl-D-erythritol 2,4-cyclodiphosphate synthase [Candidatus Omnitrophota bacterium]
MRVGIGYDIHRMVEERELILGGVVIPYIKGLMGHSDADVLLHAICDAILGAICEDDIGKHFPVSDKRYENISSLVLLKNVYDLALGKGFKINNVDTVLIAEEPKIMPFKEKMKDNITGVLKIKKDMVNIKATTNEGIGSIGRGEAIAAHAIVSLVEA